MFNWFKKKINPALPEADIKKQTKPRKKKEVKELSDKEKATAAGEPYVAILKIELNSDTLHEGSIELDWNDKFIANLIRAGYQMKPNDTDAEIIDRWFTNLCRHVVLETYEQYDAMIPDSNRVIKRRNIGDGFSEAS